MAPKILQNIKGSEIPDAWRQQIGTDPDQFYTVIIRPQNEEPDEEEMPPEEMISEEFIEAVERSSEEYKAGKGTLCRNKEELDAFFKGIWENE